MAYVAGLSAGLRETNLRILEGAMRHPEGLLTPLVSMTPEEHARFGREMVALGHAEFVSGISFREEDVWYMEDAARLLRITELGVAAIRERAGKAASFVASPDRDDVAAASFAREDEVSAGTPTMPADAESGPAVLGDVTRRFLGMLERPEGAIIDEIAEALGWRKHTVRGFLSQLRAKGFAVTGQKERHPARHGRPRMRYRLG